MRSTLYANRSYGNISCRSSENTAEGYSTYDRAAVLIGGFIFIPGALTSIKQHAHEEFSGIEGREQAENDKKVRELEIRGARRVSAGSGPDIYTFYTIPGSRGGRVTEKRPAGG